jgi:magnesium chelatase accessory protein
MRLSRRFPGFFAPLFQGLARALVLNPLVPRLFAASARTSGDTGRFLIRSTGSHIDAEGVRCYALLLAMRTIAAARWR